MLVPDILHEFELGVWKSLFTHLIRILYSASKGSDELVNELDQRLVSLNSISNKQILMCSVVDIGYYQPLEKVPFETLPATHRR